LRTARRKPGARRATAPGSTPFSPFLRSPFDDRFFEEHRLAQFCMRAKGYALQSAERKETR
jgi:hypothetical protein